MRVRLLSVLLLFLLSNRLVTAQIAEWAKPFHRYGLEDGLSHNSVYGMLQDRRGFIWFATQNGLNRFDGQKFRVFHNQPGDPESLASDNVNSIYEAEEGVFWITSWGGGVMRFDIHKRSFQSFFRNLPADNTSGLIVSDQATSIDRDAQGRMWVSTYGGGLYVMDADGQKVESIPFSNAVIPNEAMYRIWRIARDNRGRLWVGTDSGLYYVDPAEKQLHPISAILPNRLGLEMLQVREVYYARDRTLWLGTKDGLIRINLYTGAIRSYDHELSGSGPIDEPSVNRIYEDQSGAIWVGMQFSGLVRIDPRTDSMMRFRNEPTNPFSLPSNDIRSLMEDRSGNLWVGTRGAGVARLNLKMAKFQLYRHRLDDSRSLASGYVTGITEDDQGRIWVGTDYNGISILDPLKGTFEQILHKPGDRGSLASNKIRALLLDRNKKIWVGTQEGLDSIEPGENGFKHYIRDPNQSKGLLDDSIFSLFESTQGQLYIGTETGLSVLSSAGFENFAFKNHREQGLFGTRVMAFCEDQSGTLWVGTNNGGLFRFNAKEKRFINVSESSDGRTSLNNRTVTTLAITKDGLWIGTFGAGLSFLNFQTQQFQHFGQQNGLPNNIVFGILKEGENRLWLSTNKGLSRFDLGTQTFRNFDREDGLQGYEYNYNAYYRAANGEFFFGGMAGLNRFNPSRIFFSSFVPPIVLSEIRVMDREISLEPHDGAILELPSDRNFLSFEFASLDYTAPWKNQYRYKLEGVDSAWVESNQAQISYHNLVPGHYLLRVQGSNHDGIWNEQGTAYEIQIHPPFYRTKLAYLCYLVLLILLIGMGHHLLKNRELTRERLKFLQESEQLAHEANRAKSAFLAHMTHELRTPLNAIIGYTELIEEDLRDLDETHPLPVNTLRDLDKVKSSAYSQLGLVNNILELTKIELGDSKLFLQNFSVAELIETTRRQMESTIVKSGNRIKVSYDRESLGAIYADVAKLRSILLNLLSNANKFMTHGEVGLVVKRLELKEQALVEFQISDTGIGMSNEETQQLFREFTQMVDHNKYGGTGLGLYVSRYFCRQMGGSIQVKSRLGEGSCFTFTIPVRVESPDALEATDGEAILMVGTP